MFTGIIAGLGAITRIQSAGQGRAISIKTDFALENIQMGESIAVSGVCLTVVAMGGNGFTTDVSPETLAKTTFAYARIGERVNIERALRLSDRLGGHLVSGHIDGVGTIAQKKKAGNAEVITIAAPASITQYLIQKGSVAVDGISLTVNRYDKDGFDVSIIPHTAKLTTIGFKKEGQAVNLEIDVIAKYVERFLLQRSDKGTPKKASKPGLDFGQLAEAGFV